MPKVWKCQKGISHCFYYTGKNKSIDIVIVTAVKVELDAVRAHLHRDGEAAWTPEFTVPVGDWFSCTFQSPEDGNVSARVALVKSACMGLAAAASITSLATQTFRPSYVVMLGITAGRHQKTCLGDIIVPLKLWDYGCGKWIEENDQVKFLPRSEQLGPFGWMSRRFETLRTLKAEFSEMQNDWIKANPRETSVSIPQVILEPMVSGAAVVDAKQIWADVLKQNDKVHAIDMEAFGVHQAVHDAFLGYHPQCIVAKSVSDHGVEKRDDPQAYASYTSARFFRLYLQRMILGVDAHVRPSRVAT